MSPDTERTPGTIGPDAAIESHRRAEPMLKTPEADAAAFAATLVDGEIASVVRLTARAPWFDGMAALYAFACNRWDTPAELISCGPNQQPEGSGWDGTVVFVDFTAPEPGEYVIVVAVHGPQSMVQVRGPWGAIDRPMPAGQDHQLVGTTWSGAGELHFSIAFSGRWLGAVSAVQIFEQVE